MEIERKFLLSAMPNITPTETATIKQSYVAITEDVECRIREKISEGITSYKMCFKSNGDLSREEVELTISKEDYRRLLSLANNQYISKQYATYLLGNLRLECSIVDANKASSFIYAEVEFDSEEEANAFDAKQIPNLIREVTYNKAYKMKNYWLENYQKEK